MVITEINEHDNVSTTTPYNPYRGLRIDHQPTSLVAIVEGLTMIIIFLGSLIVNLIALVAILRDKKLRRNVHNWLIINLIINDLGITITSMSFSIISVFDHGYFLVHSDIMCLINGAGGTGFSFGNFATILAISLDRFLSVVLPNRFPPSKTRIIIYIVFCWMVPIANIIPPSFELISDFKYHPFTHHCSPIWQACLYYIICIIILFGITVPVMVFCYIGVFWTLRRQQQVLRSYAKGRADDDSLDDVGEADDSLQVTNPTTNTGLSLDDLPSREGKVSETVEESSTSNLDGHGVCKFDEVKSNQEKIDKKMIKQRSKRRSLQKKLTTDKRIAMTGTLLVMTTVVCWAPYCIVHSCFIPIHVTHSLGVFTMWLAYTNSLLDPIIYSFMNRRVRARYHAMMSNFRMTVCKKN
ncbi:5-hydroxytryptamine receptor 1-like [Lytechinus variegatus]|uniref:5-hydroxytryptamine receptor 1-like n=1 Tax=Lytechinus variegatus TaxID=7654 RepID=UPI001BB2AF9D|nr:5-hydroxytryptamine receptor 1-like [Lytechinus variegatus]